MKLILGKIIQTKQRRQTILKYIWSNELKFFTDFNFIQKNKQTNRLTLAGIYPLWLNIATNEQTKYIVEKIETLFLFDGSLVTIISKQSTQQWDYPNGWAPLQYIAYRSLIQISDYKNLARIIRQRWMSLNERVFKETGKMMEKYDVVNINKPADDGEYKTQDGFEWTNGVYLQMLYDQQLELEFNLFFFFIKMKLEDLPGELWFLILSYLSPIEVFHIFFN
ncbi:unnamed protein product, partial [Rotaria sordida]